MLLLIYMLANKYEQKNFSKSLGKHFEVFREVRWQLHRQDYQPREHWQDG